MRILEKSIYAKARDKMKMGKKNEQDEEVVEHIAIDGACMRTPDEDIKWAEEQAELEAQAAKGGKGKAAPGKKK